MAAKPVARPELPKGLSPQEEADWWDRHPDYWDALDTPDEVIEPTPVLRTKPITIRLPVAMIEALKHEATERAVPYQTLIRMWLQERLDRDTLP
jgi:hypothetical protein